MKTFYKRLFGGQQRHDQSARHGGAAARPADVARTSSALNLRRQISDLRLRRAWPGYAPRRRACSVSVRGVFFGPAVIAWRCFKLEAPIRSAQKFNHARYPGFHGLESDHRAAFVPVPPKSLPFTLFAVVLVPTIVAFHRRVAMFKRRVGGVYFAIITQALVDPSAWH